MSRGDYDAERSNALVRVYQEATKSLQQAGFEPHALIDLVTIILGNYALAANAPIEALIDDVHAHVLHNFPQLNKRAQA